MSQDAGCLSVQSVCDMEQCYTALCWLLSETSSTTVVAKIIRTPDRSEMIDVVKQMCTQWDALQLFYFFTDQWLDARLNAAENIYKALNNESLRLYLFLDWVLPKFTDISEHFQSERVKITTVITIC